MRCDWNAYKASERFVKQTNSHVLGGMYWCSCFGKQFGGNKYQEIFKCSISENLFEGDNLKSGIT